MSVLGAYPTPFGARVVICHHRGRFWTERTDGYGTTLVFVPTALEARDHYELAQAEGETFNCFPYRLRERLLGVGR